MPHVYIRNRKWFSTHGGRPELNDFQTIFSKLTTQDRHDLLSVLSRCRNSDLEIQLAADKNAKLRNIAVHYRGFTSDEERMIWKKIKRIKPQKNGFSRQDVEDVPFVSEDECVEDADINDAIMVV